MTFVLWRYGPPKLAASRPQILNGHNIFRFKDIDVILTLFCMKFNVLEKCIFDLDARVTFSRSKI
jgi:hypothetical protein